jgi:L-rhamnose isomerase
MSKVSDEQRERILAEGRSNAQRRDDAETPLQEALRRPVADPVEAWRRDADETEAREVVARRLDTTPVDWGTHIRSAVAAEREHTNALLVELVAEMQAQANDDLEKATRSLTVELLDLKATLAELRVVLATERRQKQSGTVIDLPRRVN